MRNIYFTREPACTYDLFFIFGLYFNQEYYINNFVNYQKAVQDTEFYKALLSEIGEVPEELRPFFRVKDDGKCFMTKMYFDRYEDILNTSYCLATVQEDLMNIPELTGFLLDYYFSERENREDFNLTQLSALIRKSSYEAALKSSLYAFLIEPTQIVRILIRELEEKTAIINRRAQKGPIYYSDLEQQFHVENVSALLEECEKQHGGFTTYQVSFCLINKNCMRANFYGHHILLIFGYDYLDMMDYLLNCVKLPSLDVFCDALAEKNRLKILDYILEHEEATIQDLERAMGLSGTNAYYHLTILIKANVVRTRNQGRLVIYSLNREYFDFVGDLLQKYQSKSIQRPKK